VIEKVLFGLASALAFEGLMLAIFPLRIKKAAQLVEKISSATLSVCGLLMTMAGILFLFVIEI
jgi:uncharacterized protein YjeT (DUF2065 family)